MNRKIVICLLTGCLMCIALFAEAQQPRKVPRIGYLIGTSSSSNVARTEAFRQGLRESGYVEGKNILIESRFTEGKLDRERALAAELVGMKVDVIVTGGSVTTRAAKEATTTIPIVIAFSGNPERQGVVASLASQGGNITGLGQAVI